LFETALADDSIVLVDATTLSIKEGNQQAYQHLGYSRQQFLQLKLTDIQTSQSANDLVANLVDVQSSQQYAEFDSQHRSKNGDIHHVQVKARNIDVSEKRLVLCTWRDIQPMINADKQ
ncbi:MAG: PAS domain S-box-containing protein, partial [Phenylobacterium sp.]